MNAEINRCMGSRKNQEWTVKMKVAQSCPTLCDPMNYIAHQFHLLMEFSRQEYWSVFPIPSPGDLPNPGITPTSPPALAGRFFTTSATWETPLLCYHNLKSVDIRVQSHFSKFLKLTIVIQSKLFLESKFILMWMLRVVTEDDFISRHYGWNELNSE